MRTRVSVTVLLQYSNDTLGYVSIISAVLNLQQIYKNSNFCCPNGFILYIIILYIIINIQYAAGCTMMNIG